MLVGWKGDNVISLQAREFQQVIKTEVSKLHIDVCINGCWGVVALGSYRVLYGLGHVPRLSIANLLSQVSCD